MDYSNPSKEDLKQWAYCKDSEIEQDFDLMVADIEYGPILLELASDPKCPMREFFLSCLYLIVGEHFRGGFGINETIFQKRSWKKEIGRVKDFVESAKNTSDPLITNWVNRALYLIEHPAFISSEDWCLGRIARSDITQLN